MILVFCLGGCGESAKPVAGGYDFAAPRTAWISLDSETRTVLDAGLAVRPKPERVVIHSTGSTAASASGLEDNHLRVRGITGGMAYHFVIGNGQGIPDGAIVIGPRWQTGKSSAAESASMSDASTISCCLVGDLNRKPPTTAQLQTLDELLDYLTGKLGWIPVSLHRELEDSPRGCPGKEFPLEEMRHAYSR